MTANFIPYPLAPRRTRSWWVRYQNEHLNIANVKRPHRQSRYST